MQKAQTYTSPFGKAIYPHLSKCDVRFKPEGEYKVDLSLKDTQAQELIKVIKQYQLKAVAEAKEKTNKKTIKEHAPPYKKDEEGNVIFKFKMKASGTNGKTGDTFKQRPALFDNELKPISPDITIWGGSILRVSFQPHPWYTPALGAPVIVVALPPLLLSLAVSVISANNTPLDVVWSVLLCNTHALLPVFRL